MVSAQVPIQIRLTLVKVVARLIVLKGHFHAVLASPSQLNSPSLYLSIAALIRNGAQMRSAEATQENESTRTSMYSRNGHRSCFYQLSMT